MRTKGAVIVLVCDDCTACAAFDATAYAAYDGEEDTMPCPLYEAVSRRAQEETPDFASEEAYQAACARDAREVTCRVLGWLWTHGYGFARWGAANKGMELSRFEGKPKWAKKEVYECEDAAVGAEVLGEGCL
jgi:hypothetical protein